MKRFLIVLVSVIHLVLIDAITKEIAAAKLSAAISVIPNFFDLVLVRNFGCAWGMFQGQVWPLAVFGALALAVIIWKRKEFFGEGKAAAVAEVLLYAGIIGNLIDRVFRGYVIDFLDFHWYSHHFPCFNLADSFICIAAGMMILCSFGKRTS
jgi:signal peptidase II